MNGLINGSWSLSHITFYFLVRNLIQTTHPFFFNGTLVTNGQEHKHLGLILDSTLSLTNMLMKKITKAKKGTGIYKVPFENSCPSGLLMKCIKH